MVELKSSGTALKRVVGRRLSVPSLSKSRKAGCCVRFRGLPRPVDTNWGHLETLFGEETVKELLFSAGIVVVPR